MISDTFQADTDRALRAMVTQPALPHAPTPKTSVWSAPFRALPAAAAEGLAGLGEMLKGYGEVQGSLGVDSAGGMFSTQNDTERQQAEAARVAIQTRGPQGRNAVSAALRDVSESYRPDPATASTAENIVFGVTKGLGKAVGYTAVAGPFGAGALGIDEGLTATDDLQRKGVDDATAQGVGALTGAVSGASLLLPVVGPTAAKTVGLAVAGGPAAFIAQQAATRAILKDAGYAEIAEQYDPLDPAGLTLATLMPAAFAGLHIRGLAKAGKAAPEVVDAAMVHNLSLQQDVRTDAEPVLPLKAPVREAEVRADGVTPPTVEDPMQAVRQRVKQLEQDHPEGKLPEMERVRQEAKEGTDTELGTLDKDLVKVAAECALSL